MDSTLTIVCDNCMVNYNIKVKQVIDKRITAISECPKCHKTNEDPYYTTKEGKTFIL